MLWHNLYCLHLDWNLIFFFLEAQSPLPAVDIDTTVLAVISSFPSQLSFSSLLADSDLYWSWLPKCQHLQTIGKRTILTNHYVLYPGILAVSIDNWFAKWASIEIVNKIVVTGKVINIDWLRNMCQTEWLENGNLSHLTAWLCIL